MNTIVAMSKIATLKFKNQTIDVKLREKKGGHNAPYIVIFLQDKTQAHITIQDQEVYDSSIKKADILNYVKVWIRAYEDELLRSWESAKKGKALEIPNEIPQKKPKKSKAKVQKVRRIKEIKTSNNLKMLIRFETGEIRVIDFKKDVIPTNKSFKVLADPAIFIQAESDITGVAWESVNIDIEAADLYEDSTPVDLTAITLAR